MTTPQVAASPNLPRAKRQQPKSANSAGSTNGPGQTPRSKRRNPNRNGRNASAENANTVADRAADTEGDSGAASSDEVVMTARSRNPKQHVQPQPSPSRIISPAHKSTPSHTTSKHSASNVSSTPVKSQAYAGPTFHASPAASALPIPKFLSRSVPAKPQPSLSSPPEGFFDTGSPPSHSPPSPTRVPVSESRGPRGVGLEQLFMADREEKARSAGSNHGAVPALNSPVNFVPQSARQHVNQNSNNSPGMFPIELDSESLHQQISPPPVSLSGQRSTTAPSRIPQAGLMGMDHHGDPTVQEILARVSYSQQKPVDYTPPRTADRLPSEPSSRHHTPSPFHTGSPYRSASGPTTPAPSAQEHPADFFYGNRNLSPMFKAAQNNSGTKRNSGLRMELTADSPVLSPMGPFPPANTRPLPDARHAPNNIPRDVFGAPTSPRRGSMPNMQGAMGSPNKFQPRMQGRRAHNTRPDSYPNNRDNRSAAVNSPSKPKVPVVNPFIPASVQAKQYSTTPKAPTATARVSGAPAPTATDSRISESKVPDSSSLELDLKRLLNVQD